MEGAYFRKCREIQGSARGEQCMEAWREQQDAESHIQEIQGNSGFSGKFKRSTSGESIRMQRVAMREIGRAAFGVMESTAFGETQASNRKDHSQRASWHRTQRETDPIA